MKMYIALLLNLATVSTNLIIPDVRAGDALDAGAALSDLCSGDRNKALSGMETLYAFPRKQLKGVLSTNDLQRALVGHLGRWDRNSDKAALLLGDLGGEETVAALKSVLRTAEQVMMSADPMETRKAISPRIRVACLKALLKLGDKDATEEVLKWLRAESCKIRAEAVECVAFAERTDLASELFPLLSDSRDAVNIAPSGAEYFLRVCDVAVEAIKHLTTIDVSFSVQQGARYSEQQIEEVRTKAQALLSQKKDH